MNNGNTGKEIKTIGVLEKAIKIIAFLEESRSNIGLSEIARSTGINKATCYRILQTLLSDNIVAYDEISSKYRLGFRLIQLGATVQQQVSIHRIALPYLRRLTEDTGATSNLCILNDNKAMCIERIEGQHVQILVMKIGDVWPLYAGAAPRAILAYLDDETIEQSLASDNNLEFYTKLDKEHYYKMIDDTRRQGYTVSYEDIVDTVTGIGAPIFDYSGKIVAAISIGTSTSLLLKERTLIENAQLVISAAHKISKSLGWPGHLTNK